MQIQSCVFPTNKPRGAKLRRITLQVVLPQLWVSDVGDVVERPRQDRLVLELAVRGGLLHCFPGGLCELWRLGDASRKFGSQPERRKHFLPERYPLLSQMSDRMRKTDIH